MRIAEAALLFLAAASAGTAAAHPTAPGALDVRVLADRVHLRATVPSEQILLATAAAALPPGGYGEYLRRHLRVTADGRTLEGRVVAVSGPRYDLEYGWTRPPPERLDLGQDAREALYVVRVVVEGKGQPPREGLLLKPGATLSLVPDPRDRRWPAGAFVHQGIIHILTGYDHLLFVAALVLAASTLWDLVKVISAFTAAHTLTLALATLGAVRVPEGLVEPLIAGSIVFVAAQSVFWPERSQGRGRFLVAFFFGLFHGLGFAGGLRDALLELHGGGLAAALVAFSVGVEVGHQTVVLPAFAALWLLRGARAEPGPMVAGMGRLASGAISLVGAVYLVAALR